MYTKAQPQTLDFMSQTNYNDIMAYVGAFVKEVIIKNMAPKVLRASIYDDGGIWRMKAVIEDPDTKKQITKTRSTGLYVKDHTKRKAQKALEKYVQDIENGEVELKPTSKAVRRAAEAVDDNVNEPEEEENSAPFSEYVEKFLLKKEKSLRPDTVCEYKRIAEKHVLPALGDIPITELCLADVQKYCDDKSEVLSVNTVHKHHVVISGAVMEAVREGILSVDFTDYVEFQRMQKFTGTSYTEEQLADLLDAAYQEGEPIYSAIVLASAYALRRSEIAGLRWCDVNFDEGYIHVCNTVVRVGADIVEEEQTKTKASNRIIPFVGGTVEYFRNLFETHKANGLLTDDLRTKVCRWPDGHNIDPTYISKRSRIMMKKYGLEHIRLHDLRHTAATLLARRVPPKQVQAFLGHSDISTTLNIYTHLLDSDKLQTSDTMNSIMSGILPSGRRQIAQNT